MKNVFIQVSFDEEKLNALVLYLGKKDLLLANELFETIQKLFEKHVPIPVKEFIEARNMDTTLKKTAKT